MDEKFYLISFEYLCKTEDGEYLPIEVGMVEISMKDGIIQTLHQFIDPGTVRLPLTELIKQNKSRISNKTPIPPVSQNTPTVTCDNCY